MNRKHEFILVQAQARPADGRSLVDVGCKKCGRRWLRLHGDRQTGLDNHGVAYVSLVTSGGLLPTVQQLLDGKRPWYLDPWTGKRTHRRPSVSVNEFAGEYLGRKPLGRVGSIPDYGPKRYRISCHKRCGRVEIFTHQTIREAFAAAVSQGHAETAL